MAEVIISTNSVFPDENIDPKKKAEAKFLLEYAQAAFNAIDHLPERAIGYRSRLRYETIMSYALGRQDVSQYRTKLAMDEDPKAPDVLITEDSILGVLPHWLNICIGRIEAATSKVMVDTIDADASIEVRKKQLDRKARLLLRQQFQLQGMPEMAGHQEVAKMPGDPDDMDGLDIVAMGERHPIVADAQDLIRSVFNNNCLPSVRREWITSLVHLGAAVTKDDTEPDGITTRCCALDGIVMNYCEYPDFRDLKHIGEIRRIPVSALEVMSGGKITRADLQMLYSQSSSSMSANWYEVNGVPSSFNSWYGTAIVNVLDLEILSVDKIEREESKNKFGNLEYRNATKDEDKKKRKESNGAKFVTVPIQNVYRLKWVIGTDMVFDYGKQINIKRNERNPARAVPSFHIAAVGFYKMTAYSRTEACIPEADGIQMAAYRRQKAINTVKGTTYEMDISKIEDVDISAGGEAMTPMDVIDLWKQEDILVYRSRLVNGQNKDNSGAIRAVQGGIGQELNEYRILIEDYINLIRQTLGVNEVTDGSTVNPKNLNSTNAAMAQSTNNALSDVLFADKKMKQELAASILIRGQDMIRHGRGDEIAAVIGKDSVDRIGKAPDLDKYHFGVTIEDDPTPEEDRLFMDALMSAVQTGQITVDEQFMAQSLYKDNVRKGQLYLSYRVRKNKEEAAAKAQQDIQANGQQQQQSAQITAHLEQETLQIKYDLELRNAIQIEKEKQNTVRLAGDYGLEEERIGASGRVESAFVQGTAKDASNRRDNAGKLIKEGMGHEVGKVDIPADLESRVAPVTDAAHPQLPVKTGFSFLSPVDKHRQQQQAATQQMQEPEQEEMPQMGAMQQPDMQEAMMPEMG